MTQPISHVQQQNIEPTATIQAGLHLYNTLTRQRELITTLEPGHLRMYSCGPTVYRYIHIGNLRTFTMADWIRRTALHQGLRVTHVKNITDVGHMRQEVLDRGEDKIVSQSRLEGKTPWQIAQHYTDAFMDDEARLNILPADHFPRATDHIPEMITMTQQLLDRGFAYEVAGNVFFTVKAFAGYGELSGNLLEHLGQGQHQQNENDPLKRAPEDFPLWKSAEPGRIMAWDSPWGRGFPGWHIECSAMSEKYLGPQFDLHTGGVDNIFPHHEDERAQSEAASGKRFVTYWVHGQHLLADGLKMAKSSGNAYTLADIEARGFSPMALRYFFTTARYRSAINFTFRALQSAQTALQRLLYHVELWQGAATSRIVSSEEVTNNLYYLAFMSAINDDLNVPQAMSVVWQVARDTAILPDIALALFTDFDSILGLGIAEPAFKASQADTVQRQSVTLPEPVAALASTRSVERAHQGYPIADALRQSIISSGFEVRDLRTQTVILPQTTRTDLISRSVDVQSHITDPATTAFSVNLLTHNSRSDVERCINSVVRNAGDHQIEIVIIDNGSTDDTLEYLTQLYLERNSKGIPVQVIFADHDMGFAAGRNASFRASRGEIIIQIDTSIEVTGDIWTPIAALLADPTIGLIGPYGLVTTDLKEFTESTGPDVDAIEGYMMAFRRSILREVGPADEKFRFYRLMDIDYSFEFKKAGYRVVASEQIIANITKHQHREWYSLTPEEQATKSKKNYDIFRRRRHHCQSLLVMNYHRGQSTPWGHDHGISDPSEIDPRFEHGTDEAMHQHSHEHKHWPDHSHTHIHDHAPSPCWFDSTLMARYVTSRETDFAPILTAVPPTTPVNTAVVAEKEQSHE